MAGRSGGRFEGRSAGGWPLRQKEGPVDLPPMHAPHAGEEAVEEVEDALAEAWRNLTGASGYLPVLLLILASMLSIPLLGDAPLGVLFNVFLISAGLLVTVFRSTTRPDVRRVAWIAVAAAAGTSVVALVVGNSSDHLRLSTFLGVLYLALLLGCFPLVLVRSFQHRRVTVNTVCATLSAYLLIGLIFMAVYRLMGLLAPPFFSQGGTPTGGQYAYFSFITLTTVGYGDLTPGSDAARSIVMFEAVIGQVFLVTTMARVVSLLGEERRSPVVLRTSIKSDGSETTTTALDEGLARRIADTVASRHASTAADTAAKAVAAPRAGNDDPPGGADPSAASTGTPQAPTERPGR